MGVFPHFLRSASQISGIKKLPCLQAYENVSRISERKQPYDAAWDGISFSPIRDILFNANFFVVFASVFFYAKAPITDGNAGSR